MSVLNKLKAKKKERLTKKHPLHDADMSLKYPYCVGVAIQGFVNEDLGSLEKEYISNLIYSIGLSEDYEERVIEAAKTAEGDTIDGIIELLDDRDKKYMFILDLYGISNIDSEICEAEKEAIDIFADMLHLKAFEKEFLYNFAQAARVKDNEAACKAYDELMKQGIEPSFNILKHFMQDFDYIQIIEGYELKNGEILTLNKPCIVKGVLKVPSGCRLIMDGADIQLAGQIIVEGGQISIDDSYIKAIESCNDTMFEFVNVVKVEINKTTFDGNRKLGVILQSRGILEVKESTFMNTNNFSAIYLMNDICNLWKCIFDDCTTNDAGISGGALSFIVCEVDIEECEFNNCEAESGGAIGFPCDGSNGEIVNCRFNNCNAKNEGAAVYICSHDEVQMIDCQYNNCSPSNSVTYRW